MNDHSCPRAYFKSLSRFFAGILAFFLLWTAVAACSNSEPSDQETPLIYTSFFPLYNFANYLTDSEVEIRNLLPLGGSAHDWEPDPRTVAELEDADILVLNGLHLEPWADKLIPQLEDAGVVIVELGERVLSEHADESLHAHDHDHGHEQPGIQAALELAEALHAHDHHDHEHTIDPHIWLNPMMAAEQVEILADELSTLLPEYEEHYLTRSADFRSRAESLDAELQTGLAEQERPVFIVTHEAFSYLASSYDLMQIGVSGMMSEQEPNPQAMALIIDYMRAYDIPTIYYDAYGSDKIAETIASETGAQVLRLYTLETVAEEDQSGENTYFDLMQKNMEALKQR